MVMDTTFRSFIKMQVSKAKPYGIINQEVEPAPERFVELFLPKHWL
jgi:hypothetical protein